MRIICREHVKWHSFSFEFIYYKASDQQEINTIKLKWFSKGLWLERCHFKLEDFEYQTNLLIVYLFSFEKNLLYPQLLLKFIMNPSKEAKSCKTAF